MGEWVRAKGCAASECIEVRFRDDGVTEVRRRDHTGVTDARRLLRFLPDEWAAFVQGIKDGDFDHV